MSQHTCSVSALPSSHLKQGYCFTPVLCMDLQQGVNLLSYGYRSENIFISFFLDRFVQLIKRPKIKYGKNAFQRFIVRLSSQQKERGYERDNKKRRTPLALISVWDIVLWQWLPLLCCTVSVVNQEVMTRSSRVESVNEAIPVIDKMFVPCFHHSCTFCLSVCRHIFVVIKVAL